jgi:hypothetical protein
MFDKSRAVASCHCIYEILNSKKGKLENKGIEGSGGIAPFILNLAINGGD